MILVTCKDPSKLKMPMAVYVLDGDSECFDASRMPFKTELTEVKRLLAAEKFDNEAVYTCPAGGAVRCVVFLGTGQVKCGSRAEKLRTLGARAYGLARRRRAESFCVVLDGADGLAALGAVSEGVALATYEFNKYKTVKPETAARPEAEFLVRPEAMADADDALLHTTIVRDATSFCRDLVNEPPSGLVPEDLARAAASVARKCGLKCQVLGEAALRRQGYMGTVTVGGGSVHKPCMIVMHYRPRKASGTHLALVGKAVTFDSGGYCIKSGGNMWRMKDDMAGGAAVISAMMAVAALQPDFAVTAIVPAVQNLIGHGAVLPGDVIRAKNGKTVHVDNTDAEGRLILMDALIRAAEEKATHVVDLATLTGAMVAALGPSMAGIFGNDQEFVDAIVGAGARAGEDYWQMPLYDEYREMLTTDNADINNVSGAKGGSSITAALFLREFVAPELKWAHLDIAGPVMQEKAWKYHGPGATGFGVRTLIELILGMARP